MLEESIKLPLVTQTTEPDDVSLRSISTGKSGSSKSAKNAVPNYPRASTGSCHDFCKYGRTQAFEEKPWHPMRRRIAAKPPGTDGQSSADNEVLLSRNKKSPVVKLRSSSQTSSHVSGSLEIIKHEVSVKTHGSRRISGTDVGNDQSSVGSETFSGRKNSAKVSLNPSSDSQKHISDSVDIIKQESSTKPPSSQNPLEDEVHVFVMAGVVAGENNLETNLKPSSDSKIHVSASPDIVEQEKSKNPRFSKKSKESKLLSERKKTASRQKSSDLNSKACLPVASKITSHGLPLSSGKLKTFHKGASKKVSARSASSKIKAEAVNASPSPDSPEISNGRNRRGSRMGIKTVVSNAAVKELQITAAASSKLAVRKVLPSLITSSSKVSAKKVKASPSVSVGPRPALSRVSSMGIRKKSSQKVGSPLKSCKGKSAEPYQPDVVDVAEKTLYVIEVATEKKCGATEYNGVQDESHPCPSSMPNPQSFTTEEVVDEEESVSKVAVVSEDDRTLGKCEFLDKEVKSPKKEFERSPRNAAADGSEDKDRTSMINSHRGKVVNLHSESNTPRKLRFRRGRIVGEKQNVQINQERRSFKQRGQVEGSKNNSPDGSENVVLRHQDTAGKKDAQGLLNSLIEETASKLVETRKSKVKALVGAFESVISSKKPNL